MIDLDQVADPPLVSAEVVERLDARALEDALSSLQPDQGEALLLCDLWGFTYVEIAEITGAPVGTVRSRLARARARLVCALSDTVCGRGHSRRGR